MSESKYAAAGVDIEAGKKATDLMKSAVKATYNDHVLAGLGAFGGLFSAKAFGDMANPVLVASTDGVGTKTRVAARLNRWDTIGHDIVNHCVNDILVQGARPLFFLDYVASSKLEPEQIATVVRGIAGACQAAGAALLGGETAEMPGVYQEGELDLVGTIIGVVDQDKIIDGSKIQFGDKILALASSGLHTNGYTLGRNALAEESWIDPMPELDQQKIGDILLTPHRSYLPQISRLLDVGVDIHGLAHITGGGVYDNLPRILPAGYGANITADSWQIPPIFDLIQQKGDISPKEMFHVINMGLGMFIIVNEEEESLIRRTIGNEVLTVGEIIPGDQTVNVLGI